VEIRDVLADVFVAVVAQHVELGLVDADDYAVRTDPVQADGGSLEEVAQLPLAALELGQLRARSYCRSRARNAVRTALTSAATRSGRSSTVTLPSDPSPGRRPPNRRRDARGSGAACRTTAAAGPASVAARRPRPG
jgi:hypothetical protein